MPSATTIPPMTAHCTQPPRSVATFGSAPLLGFGMMLGIETVGDVTGVFAWVIVEGAAPATAAGTATTEASARVNVMSAPDTARKMPPSRRSGR